MNPLRIAPKGGPAATLNTVDFVQTPNDMLVRPTFVTAEASNRFEQHICLIEKHLPHMTPAHRFIASVISFDGILSMDALEALLQASKAARWRGDRLDVSWLTQDGKLVRRTLSARSAISFQSVHHTIHWKLELASFTRNLILCYPDAKTWRSAEIWPQVFSDAAAWLYLHTPHLALLYTADRDDFRLLSDRVLDRQMARSATSNTPTGADVRLTDDLGDLHDVAFDKLLDSTPRPRSGASLIKSIQDLLRPPSAESDIRMEDHRWRKQLQPKLAIVAELVASQGNAIDAILLSWVHFLLTTGSLRLSNPTVTTVARYFDSICEPLSNAFAQLPNSPIDLTSEEWGEFFEKLTNDNTLSEQKTAISSFHLFCVATLGIDPVPSALFRREQKTMSAPQFIWPHEIAECLRRANNVSLDPRVNDTIATMLALSAGMPFRIGELHSLRRKDLINFDDALEVHIHPKRGSHQGKSDAARRVMRTSDALLIEIIRAWDQRRSDEGDDKDALLFGDPHRPASTYRFGFCARLLNKLLTEVTQDQETSFHTLRHVWVTHNFLASLEVTETPQSISPLHELSVQAGHNHVSTTISHYFLRAETALRSAIDQRLRQLPLDAQSVSFWTGQKPDALRKAKQRSTNKKLLYFQMLQAHAVKLFTGSRSSEGSNAVTFTHQSLALQFDTLRKVLSDIRDGFKGAAIASRCSISEATLRNICTAAACVIHQLDRTGKRRSTPPLQTNSQLTHALDQVRIGALFHGLSCHLKVDPLLMPMAARMARLTEPSPRHRRASQAWLDVKNGIGLDLSDPTSATPLFDLLKDYEFPGSALVLRVQVEELESAHSRLQAVNSNEVQEVSMQIASLFSEPLRIESVKRRAGLPKIYLMVSRSAVDGREHTPSAQLRMNRLHGLMFSIAVWCNLEQHHREDH